ncbi:MAG: DUF393 domain-containing protein [Flavobacteriales bacterium]|jgi:predicted DCC family thiol-disulfide oxidoreductase YuxK|nr:DUF393 domain-containing protein [Flavobacteriales bacterium]MBK7941952.1 DUF393 domain-containing protein [Flavobacteriales bacterium]MBK8947752.1 DUF393 domain-containing protein [Flavobacteriales bacterium]MBK9700494.1 DUF393 domain-containing protein [Flavobacteriales bacterium]
MDGAPLPDRLLLFDGVCNLCTGAVRFVVPRDRRGRIRFAALQGPTGQRVLREQGLSTAELSTLIYLRQGRVLTRSTAALQLFRDLDGAWPLLAVLLGLPRVLRDAVYDRVARRRYRWFGRTEACLVPGPDLAARFVD